MRVTYKELASSKKAFIFELDNVLYPEKDYLLQVYYLFANLLEYTETIPPAEDLTSFFKKVLEHHGTTDIFQRAVEVFGIDEKYAEQFRRMHVNAKLPLKLLLFPEIKEFIREALLDGKLIFILTKGNPLMQLNKLKQMEWDDLAEHVKIYFYDELILQGYRQPIDYLLQENGLTMEDILVLGAGITHTYGQLEQKADYISVSDLLPMSS